MKRASAFALIVSVALASCGGSDPQPAPAPPPGGGNPAPPAISTLAPSSVNAGNADLTLTVNGTGFVAGSIVRWEGRDLTTSFASATQLTARLSSTDLAIAGNASVTVSNPAPNAASSAALTFTIASKIANGEALAGDRASSALAATANVAPVGVGASDVDGDFIMTRLDLRFAKDATVGQVNDALGAVGAGIVSMTSGFPSVTIGIPHQPSLEAMDALIRHLEASPGIRLATRATVDSPQVVFHGSGADHSFTPGDGSPAATIRHLLAERFPAAWNAVRTDVFGDPSHPTAVTCRSTPIPVVVWDGFAASVDHSFTDDFPILTMPEAPAAGFSDTWLQHGYFVSQVLGSNMLGANPFPRSGCIDLRLLQLASNRTPFQNNDYFVAHMPAGRFILNVSSGFSGQKCGNQPESQPCVAPRDRLASPLDFAVAALDWKEQTASRWRDFLVVVSAGNGKDKHGAAIYPGFGDSRFRSRMSIAGLDDTDFHFVTADSLWTPSAADRARGFVSLVPPAAEVTQFQQAVTDAGMNGIGADNVIVVGSVQDQPASTALSRHVRGDELAESVFSERSLDAAEISPDVLAVGENVFDPTDLKGTSFSAPQVAGLASLLWMLSDDLRSAKPIQFTKGAIVDNARNRVIDAYASVLSLDPAELPDGHNLPIRQTLLDTNRNSRFEEADIEDFLRHLFLVDATGAITHQVPASTAANFGRYDLNGDGFTTSGSQRESFDLDRIGSTRYGQTQLGVVFQDIEGQQIRFNETELTDLEILCYYAYSPMYSGNTDARKDLLAGRCGLAVTPARVSLAPGHTQQFTATLPTSDPVDWSATCGTIDPAGLYTAGTDPGPCTVTATDANDPDLTGTAEVTMIGGTFAAEDGYDVRISANDNFTGQPAVQPQEKFTSNSSRPIRPGPVDVDAHGDFNSPNFTNTAPVHYSLESHGGGPIENPVSASGTFTGSAKCSANGQGFIQDFTEFAAIMPTLDAQMSGKMTIEVPDGGLTVSLTGLLSRDPNLGGTRQFLSGPNSSLSGVVTLGSTRFELNDGSGSSPTPSQVPIDATVRVPGPGSVSLTWRLAAFCFDLADDNRAIDVARGGSLTLNYSLSR